MWAATLTSFRQYKSNVEANYLFFRKFQVEENLIKRIAMRRFVWGVRLDF